MYGRILRFLFALPVALVATAGLFSCATPPARPPFPVVENSFTRGDKAFAALPGQKIGADDSRTPPRLGFPPAPIESDARPVSRMPPSFPASCLASTTGKEEVTVEFDISPKGETANFRITRSTNSCFNSSAAKAVAQWRFLPAEDENGVPRWRREQETTITFELTE